MGSDSQVDTTINNTRGTSQRKLPGHKFPLVTGCSSCSPNKTAHMDWHCLEQQRKYASMPIVHWKCLQTRQDVDSLTRKSHKSTSHPSLLTSLMNGDAQNFLLNFSRRPGLTEAEHNAAISTFTNSFELAKSYPHHIRSDFEDTAVTTCFKRKTCRSNIQNRTPPGVICPGNSVSLAGLVAKIARQINSASWDQDNHIEMSWQVAKRV